MSAVPDNRTSRATLGRDLLVHAVDPIHKVVIRPNNTVDRWVQWHQRCIDEELYESNILEEDETITCLQCLVKETLTTRLVGATRSRV